MTSSGGTGRPRTDQDAHEKSPPQSGPEKNGSVASGNGAAANAPGAAGKKPAAGEAPSTNGRPPVGTPTPASKNVPAPPAAPPVKAPDPAVDARRQPPKPPEAAQRGQSQRGAAAVRDATKAPRTRKDTTPRGKQDSTGNPWARPGNSGATGGAPTAPGAPASGASGAAGSAPTTGTKPASGVAPGAGAKPAATSAPAVAKPATDGPERRGGPIPPPSLVAKQQAMAAQSAAAGSITGVAPLAGAVPASPTPTLPPVDTEASLDAVPAAEISKPKQARSAAPRRSGRVRKARLRLLRVDPWSVMKTSFLLSVALGITLFVAVAVLWSVLDAAGVFESVDGIISDMTTSDTNAGIDVNQYVELSRVLGFTTLIAVADVVLLTALATLGAFLYNLSASLLGGIELTLAEDD